MKINSIRTKFTISSAIAIMAMILLIEVSIYLIAVRYQIKDSGQLYSELTDVMGQSFDDLYLSFKRGIDFITMNQELQDTLRIDSQTQNEQDELNGRLKVLLTDRALYIREIDELYLFDADKQFRTVWKKKNEMGRDYLSFAEMETDWFLPSGRVSGRVIDNKLVFTRTIRSMENLDIIGYLIAVYDDNLLAQRMEKSIPNEASSIFVFDQFGTMITSNVQKMEKLVRKTDFMDIGEYQILQLENGSSVMISSYESDNTGWSIVSMTDVNYLMRSSVLLRNLVLCLGIAGIVIGITVQWGMAGRIVRPLTHMVNVVEAAEQGDYSRRMNLKTRDELSILGNAFDHMMEKTDVLVNQVLKDEIKFKESQLALMQAQINPHMLYNTLECINWLAEFNRKNEIRQVTIAFSSLMKSMTSEKRIVTIEKELMYVEDFLSIYQIMLEGKMEYQIEVDEELKKVEIPRLLIQPLVENAVVHGIKESIHGGHINVNVVPSQRGILISVMDDGAGMTAEQVGNIQAFADGVLDAGNKIGLGLRNVIERLELVYGKNTELHVVSAPDWGTVIDIEIPWQQEGEF